MKSLLCLKRYTIRMRCPSFGSSGNEHAADDLP
jgi:hypothetical protein